MSRVVYLATMASIRAATHLTDMDKGAIAAVKVLAKKIDTEADLRAALIEQSIEDGPIVKPPQLDNVSVPTYLKYCDALGLTPAGRKSLEQKKEAQGGKLATLRAVRSAATG